MSRVNALSRIVEYVDLILLERELEYKQLLDTKLKTIAEEFEFFDHEKFELIDDFIFRKYTDKSRFIIPDSMINNII